jgi:hypothetical protein
LGFSFHQMPNQNDTNLQTIENVMTEVRRNWSVMLQSDVPKFRLSPLLFDL